MAARWLLLHGTPLSPQVWDAVRALLKDETVAPDLMTLMPARALPGAAVQTHVAEGVLSELPEGGSAATGEIGSEGRSAATGEIGSDRELVVVGHSFGGQVAIEVALLAPPRQVAHVIIVCSRHTPYPAFAQSAQAVRDGAPVDIEGGLHRWFTPEELAGNPPVVGYVRDELARQPRGPWATSLDAIATYDRSGEVGAIDAPVSLIAAGRDAVSPPAAMAELADALPHARLQVVDRWAHMSPFADPDGFVAALRATGA